MFPKVTWLVSISNVILADWVTVTTIRHTLFSKLISSKKEAGRTQISSVVEGILQIQPSLLVVALAFLNWIRASNTLILHNYLNQMMVFVKKIAARAMRRHWIQLLFKWYQLSPVQCAGRRADASSFSEIKVDNNRADPFCFPTFQS